MTAKLYGFGFSHPVQCARAMLRHKGVEHELVRVPPGPHGLVMRALGFPGVTVPGLVLDGRRVQGTLSISRALEAAVPEPPLFPAERRAEVEEAEGWAEATLQHVPRRAFRWGLARHGHVRLAGSRQMGVPVPELAALLLAAPAKGFAALYGVTDEAVRRDAEALPAWLERAEGYAEAGVIGGPQPNAADFQIGATVAALLAFDDFRALLDGGRLAAIAQRHFRPPKAVLPPFLPDAWLSGGGRSERSRGW